jgi:hypothetical protein
MSTDEIEQDKENRRVMKEAGGERKKLKTKLRIKNGI